MHTLKCFSPRRHMIFRKRDTQWSHHDLNTLNAGESGRGEHLSAIGEERGQPAELGGHELANITHNAAPHAKRPRGPWSRSRALG